MKKSLGLFSKIFGFALLVGLAPSLRAEAHSCSCDAPGPLQICRGARVLYKPDMLEAYRICAYTVTHIEDDGEYMLSQTADSYNSYCSSTVSTERSEIALPLTQVDGLRVGMTVINDYTYVDEGSSDHCRFTVTSLYEGGWARLRFVGPASCIGVSFGLWTTEYLHKAQ